MTPAGPLVCQQAGDDQPARAARTERWVWGAVAVLAAVAILPTLTPGVVGLYHDDAIYVSGARLLAEGGGYRLPNLPDAPFQTKYPPFYPALLALVWRIQPAFPANVMLFKWLNLAFIAAAVMSIAMLARAQNPKVAWLVPVACQFVLATSPMMVGFADYTMTDVLFTTLVTVLMLLWGRGESGSAVREYAVIGVSAVALLSRTVAVALTAAIALDCFLRGQRARAALHAAVGFTVLLAWMFWASTYRVDQPSPLVSYYVEYEKPAFSYLLTATQIAGQIALGNVRLIADSMFFVMGPSWLAVGPVLVVIVSVGVWRLFVCGWRMPALFLGCYLPLVVSHPFAPYRYLLPLAPLLIVALVAGATHSWAVFRGSRTIFRRPAALPALLVLTVVLVGNLVWLPVYYRPSENVRGWMGANMGYNWSGFEETFEWVRRNTPQEARLGAFFDPMYSLYTGRQSVRPWFHHSETYFYPYMKANPFVGEPAAVARELRALRVDYLVLDPPVGYAEGEAAIAMLRAMLALPEVRAQQVFTSTDGRHEVYRLWSREADDSGVAVAPRVVAEVTTVDATGLPETSDRGQR